MTQLSLSKRAANLGACSVALEWLENKTAAEAWRTCNRGDWMFWLAAKKCGRRGSKNHRQIVLLACACARLSLKHVKAWEDRPRIAIEMAEAWARREGPTIEQIRCAAANTAAYANAATSYAAANAASAAANAYANAASATYAAAKAAAYAAYAAANAASAASAYASILRECADIVRAKWPNVPKWIVANARKTKKRNRNDRT